MQENNTAFLAKVRVAAADNEYQLWERNALRVELRTNAIFEQKIIIHTFHPVKAGLCSLPEGYYYSSARFYETDVDNFGFLIRWRT